MIQVCWFVCNVLSVNPSFLSNYMFISSASMMTKGKCLHHYNLYNVVIYNDLFHTSFQWMTIIANREAKWTISCIEICLCFILRQLKCQPAVAYFLCARFICLFTFLEDQKTTYCYRMRLWFTCHHNQIFAIESLNVPIRVSCLMQRYIKQH